MPDSAAILELAQTVVRELDHYGRGAPFLACVKATSEGRLEHVFVTRETVLAEKESTDEKVIYVRYRLPLGRIAETPPGQIAPVRVPECIGLNLTGNHYETSYQILARDRFNLRLIDGITDATENELAFPDGTHYLPTLRQWISCTQEEIALEAAKPRRRRMAVAVDEATDFSAVELACMRLLAHPIFDCVTFAGDPMQRLTKQGINDWRDIEALVEAPEIHELRFSYRQSKRLLGIAADLFEKSVGRPAPFEAGFKDGADDPEALRFNGTSSGDEAEWLTQRIGEIYQVCGERLPSIALIVPEEKDVKPLADLLKAPLLELFGIETEDCPQGRILGTQAKVRVFSVQFIKGLEFESVFFVGLDRMAASTPELVDRFLYVGLTRARSFLAVTHAGEFPAELSHVINHFAVGDWKRLIPQ